MSAFFFYAKDLILTRNRYTLTYEPAADRVIPSPSHLHLRIKNTSAIALRAAYLHGPFTIHVAAYPATFNPNVKLENPRRDGIPQFEPNLKAGSAFTARLTVPEDLRIRSQAEAIEAENSTEKRTITWIIEVTSQILFSSTASIKFDLSVGRDEKSLNFNFNAVQSRQAEISKPQDSQERRRRRSSMSGLAKGVFSKAINLVIENTENLWDRPALPEWEETPAIGRRSTESRRRKSAEPTRLRTQKKKKIHLVILTHGLHGNLGADMLYVKESIDATAKAAREAKIRRRSSGTGGSSSNPNESQKQGPSIAPLSGGQDSLPEMADDSDDEEIIVRGFPGNAVRTENGITYLGKRLARYILDLTYPDQPVQFIKKKSLSQKITRSMTFKPDKDDDEEDQGIPSHGGSRVRTAKDQHTDDLAYTFTSISFIGHSLGGLIQLYAIAYIQKHAPNFFEQIKPINFVALASPFLGLSNENPIYVRFALDFGLVGKTGQDLGLAWRPPTLARSGWSAVVGGLGSGNKSSTQEDSRAKPLLRILPTGPAHIVLRKFRNRTVYSNVVNDGIVPLRTSCLLFLDWRGLGKVEKARRENGLVGTFMGWGWAEVTGQNSMPGYGEEDRESNSDSHDASQEENQMQQSVVPQPPENAANEDGERQSVKSLKSIEDNHKKEESSGPIDAILNFLRPSAKTTKKDLKMFNRSQTLSIDQSEEAISNTALSGSREHPPSRERGRPLRPLATRGDSIDGDHDSPAPPKTSIFEAAMNALSPPAPPTTWIIDPSSRLRTIFHDRVYHPEDIPPPRENTPQRATSSNSMQSMSTTDEPGSGMRVEEKIARAYHRDLSWRKVLVCLVPDAHNNMIVRRTFANAYGWPVIKHLCDTHFGDTFAAQTRDEDEPSNDRAAGLDIAIPPTGEQVEGQKSKKAPVNVPEDLMRKATGELKPLEEGGIAEAQARARRDDSVEVDDSYLSDTSEDEADAQRSPFQRLWSPAPKSPDRAAQAKDKGKDKLPDTTPTVVTKNLTSEPDSIDGSGPSTTIAAGSVLPTSDSAPGGLSELGLRKSIPEAIASSSKNVESSQGGVSELVAKSASTTQSG
jgi:Putative serine esterase (DUF676)